MWAKLTKNDIDQYGYKVEDVQSINLCITAFSLVVSCLFTVSFYLMISNYIFKILNLLWNYMKLLCLIITSDCITKVILEITPYRWKFPFPNSIFV